MNCRSEEGCPDVLVGESHLAYPLGHGSLLTVTWRTRVYLQLGFALGGGVLGFVLSPWLLSVLPDWENASLPTKLIGFAGFTLGSYGIGILGVLLGAVVGLIFALVLPGRRVACPACGNPAASARDRSLFTGRTLPNRCAACHHTW